MCSILICIIKRYTLSKKEKLLKSIKNNPKDVRFDEEVVPPKNPLKAYYVISALKSLGVYDEK